MADDLDLQDMLSNPAWARWLASVKGVSDNLGKQIASEASATSPEWEKVRFTAGRINGFEEVIRMAGKLRATD